MSGDQLRLRRQALPQSPAPMRRALTAFLTALDVADDAQIDVVTAVGEALANAVEHAYREGSSGDIELCARMEDALLHVDVVDEGTFRPVKSGDDRGFGLRIIRSIAQSVKVDANDAGTAIRMVFRAPQRRAI